MATFHDRTLLHRVNKTIENRSIVTGEEFAPNLSKKYNYVFVERKCR